MRRYTCSIALGFVDECIKFQLASPIRKVSHTYSMFEFHEGKFSHFTFNIYQKDENIIIQSK